MARATFRGIPCCQLHQGDLQNTAEGGENAMGALWPRTVRCEFGEVDAFLSHSWRERWCEMGPALLDDSIASGSLVYPTAWGAPERPHGLQAALGA